jgi:hypothetical protein
MTTFYQEHRGPIRARARVGSDSSSRETRGPGLSEGTATPRVTTTQAEERPSGSRIVATDLYLDQDVLSPVLVRALTLLAQSLQLTGEGLELLRDDQMAADLNLQSVRLVLRKLFICREIGDGFAAVVDSLISALENNRGIPLETTRFQTVHNVLIKLRDEPFLSFASAIKVIGDIERAGFSTEPPGFEQLADWLTV